MSEKKRRSVVSNMLWGMVFFALAIFLKSYEDTAVPAVQIDVLEELNQGMAEAVSGEYKDREIVVSDLRLFLLSETEQDAVYAAMKSLIEFNYYELANTVYDTSLEISRGKFVVKLTAVYADYDVHKALGVEEWKTLSDEEFVLEAGKFIRENFKYQVGGKVTVPEFVERKIGQCYSYSELMYLLGKERGMDVRVKINLKHSWNSYFNSEGKEVEFDMTSGLGEV